MKYNPSKTEKKKSGSRRLCALVFVKAPEKGKVKTRLSKIIGNEIALNVYKRFALDLIETLKNIECNITICYHPSHAKSCITRWLGNSYTFFAQKGNNIGKRMANAFIRSFSKGFHRVILVGVDIPDLTEKIIDEAFSGLQKYPAVIGPAIDGGYYLIGFNADTFIPDVFEDIPWGTDRVHEKTLTVFDKKRIQVHMLPIWRDIDTYEDLVRFYKINRKNRSAAQNTISYLAHIDIGRFENRIISRGEKNGKLLSFGRPAKI